MTINDSVSVMTIYYSFTNFFINSPFSVSTFIKYKPLGKDKTSIFVLLPVSVCVFISCHYMFVIYIVFGMLCEDEASIVSLSVAGFGNIINKYAFKKNWLTSFNNQHFL